jgi:hypothetical protein
MSKERIKCLKNFAENNVMESRKLINVKLPKSKEEISKSNLKRIHNAYQHPFERIDEKVYTDKP